MMAAAAGTGVDVLAERVCAVPAVVIAFADDACVDRVN